MAQIFYTTIPNAPSANPVVDLQNIINSAIILNSGTTDNSVTVDDGDVFQCGKCKEKFTTFSHFISHKKSACQGLLVKLQGIPSKTVFHESFDLATLEVEDHEGIPQSESLLIENSNILSFPVSGSAVQGSSITQALSGSTDELEVSSPTHGPITVTTLKTLNIFGSPDSFQIDPILSKHFTLTEDNKRTDEGSTLLQEGSNCDDITLSVLDVNCEENLEAQTFPLNKKDNQKEAEAKVKCTYCEKSFKKNFDLQQHMRVHTGEKPFQCIVCGRAFAQKSHVMKHMSTHKVWPKSFETLPKFSKQSEDDNDEDANEIKQEEEIDGLEKTFVCQYCPGTFGSYSELKSHRKIHSSLKVFKCIQKDCSSTFEDLGMFLQHSLNHVNQVFYKCHLCHKQFDSLDDLGIHQHSHQTQTRTATRPVTCKTCKCKFTSIESLEAHTKTESHKHECPMCLKVFLCERFLRRHLATHASLLKYTCPVCCKAFKTEKYLEIHKVIHSNHKPYACQFCSAAFNRRDKLVRHNLSHENAKKFKCPFQKVLGCSKEFNRKDKLKQHLLTHSAGKSCRHCGKSFKSPSQVGHHEGSCREKNTKELVMKDEEGTSSQCKEDNVPTIEIVVMPVERSGAFKLLS